MTSTVLRTLCGVLCSAIVAAALPAGAAIPGVEFEADVPLVIADGMPCVGARIGGGPVLLFGIDTGDVTSVVDAKVAKSAGLVQTPIPPPTPPGYVMAAVPELHIGGLTLEHRNELVLDFATNQMPPTLAGTLAYTAFKDRILQIDYATHRVRISRVLTAPVEIPGPADHFSLITFGAKGPPIVVAQGFEIDGKPVTAQVDSMYTGSLLIYGASIDKLGMGDAAKAAKGEFFPYTDGGVTMKGTAAGVESFHGLALGVGEATVYFPTPGVHEPDGLFDATVGLKLLKDAVLTLDFHDGTISVQRPAPQASALPSSDMANDQRTWTHRAW
jgi:hypothetical protein